MKLSIKKKGNKKMWNPSKSVLASSICTKLIIVIVIGFLIAAPCLVKGYVVYAFKNPDIIIPLLVTIYACAIPGLISLFSLDRLLANIKAKNVFVEEVISWCSFAVSAILFVFGFYYLLSLLVAIAAAFFGLILRVVKNVIEQAVIIKNENDFTI